MTYGPSGSGLKIDLTGLEDVELADAPHGARRVRRGAVHSSWQTSLVLPVPSPVFLPLRTDGRTGCRGRELHRGTCVVYTFERDSAAGQAGDSSADLTEYG